jgi:hypothetical protein
MAKHSVPDFKLLEDTVASRILNAARVASKALDAQGVRHLLIGGLAVGAWGYIRATKDVDFLVGAEAFNHLPSGLVTFKPDIPIEVNGVPVDLLQADAADEDNLETMIESGGLPIVDFEVLVYLKLIAFRRRDKEDIIALLRNGLSETAIRRFLVKTKKDWSAPDLLDRFDELVQLADSRAE